MTRKERTWRKPTLTWNHSESTASTDFHTAEWYVYDVTSSMHTCTSLLFPHVSFIYHLFVYQFSHISTTRLCKERSDKLHLLNVGQILAGWATKTLPFNSIVLNLLLGFSKYFMLRKLQHCSFANSRLKWLKIILFCRCCSPPLRLVLTKYTHVSGQVSSSLVPRLLPMRFSPWGGAWVQSHGSIQCIIHEFIIVYSFSVLFARVTGCVLANFHSNVMYACLHVNSLALP